MKIHHFIGAALLLWLAPPAATLFAQKLNYPDSPKTETKDNYHGTTVADPYRWLEDDNSAETKAWVKAQNKVTDNYLEEISYRPDIYARLKELWDYPKVTAPSKKGGHYFFYKNDGLQNQSVLYMQKDFKDDPVVLLDPNKFSEDGTVSLGAAILSKDAKYLAYSISEAGSDWRTIKVMDVATKKTLSDELKWVKFSGLAWKGDGFYYSRYEKPEASEALTSANEYHKVYFHKIGDPQSKDRLVHEDKSRPKRNFGLSTTEDERFLILSATEGAGGKNLLYFRDTEEETATGFTPLVTAFKHDYDVVGNVGDKLIVMTDEGAPGNKIIEIDTKKPEPEKWKTLVKEMNNEIIQRAKLAGNKLILVTMKDVTNRLYLHNLNGKQISEIKLPGPGTVGGLSGKFTEPELFYTYNSYTTPPVVFRHNLETAKSVEFIKPEVKFDPKEFETEQVFYKSKDGAKIPMFIIKHKKTKLDGNNPAVLYGYGGFNISLNPGFNPALIAFAEMGGVYAIANLRGGGEYGEEWHEAGMLDNKQNVFDDFIAAAEYLIEKKYTSAKHLAINGGSNGGLLVGAAMTQRPELFAAAIPQVGVLDMLRFHKFTIGWAWTSEYGSSDDPEQFKTLYAYSPLHNLKKGVEYPATMIMTSDHDDRVVPAHSFKYAATLQEKYSGERPMLIRIETDAGHGAGTPTSKILEAYADKFAFVFNAAGVMPVLAN